MPRSSCPPRPLWVSSIRAAVLAGSGFLCLVAAPAVAQQQQAGQDAAGHPATPARVLPAEGTAISPAPAQGLATPGVTPMTGVPNPSGLAVPAAPTDLLGPTATPSVTPAAALPGATPAKVTAVRPRAPTTVAPGGTPVAGKSFSVPFAPGSSSADQIDGALLKGIATRLADDMSLRLEIHAYAPLPGPERDSAARHLSLLRAISLRQRLLDLGVPQDRLIVYAMGAGTTKDFDRADLTFVP